jgi:hypothetical protein
MEKLSLHRDDARTITAYGAQGAAAVHLADGSGDGDRVTLATGEGVVFRKGEVHAKGSDAGMIAIMVQLTDWTHVASVQND